MVEPVSREDPVSGRTTPTQRDMESLRNSEDQTQPPNLFYAPLSEKRGLMDDRFHNRRRNSQPQPSSSSSSGRRPPPIPAYGYPPPEHALNVPSPPYPPPAQPHYPANSLHSGFYALPQYTYPHPAYPHDANPYMSMYPYQVQNHSSEGFSPFSVTPTPSPPSTSSPNPYAAQGAYHPLHVSPRLSSPQQYYSYAPYGHSPGYQFYQPSDGDGQWWYPQQQQQPQYDPEQHYQQQYYSSERFSPATRNEPQPQPPPPPPPQQQPTAAQTTPPAPPRNQPKSPPATPSAASNQTLQRQAVRKPYHPNPPSYRSEWVMWAGNVPSDATHDELWRFFNRGPTEPPPVVPISKGKQKATEGDEEDPDDPDEAVFGGVLSIFLISRSSCAFINYKGEEFLRAGIARYNGQSLRPHDGRIPKLVCRVRKREDDLKAGVGGQRGSGMHLKWLKDNRRTARTALERPHSISSHSSSESMDIMNPMSELSVGSTEEGGEESEGGVRVKARRSYHSGSSSSYASTNSSILSRYFPKRYFILKSLSRYDLDLSVKRGLWATQKHNEGILDQAFRTSQDVYLIFGVNKSGEFYGYARMAGRIPQPETDGEQSHEQVPWAKRPPPSSASSSSSVHREPLHSVEEEPPSLPTDVFFDQSIKESPLPLPGTENEPEQKLRAAIYEEKRRAFQSAPAELEKHRRHLTVSTLSPDRSLDGIAPTSQTSLASAIQSNKQHAMSNFELNEDAPFEHMRKGSEEAERSHSQPSQTDVTEKGSVSGGDAQALSLDPNPSGPADSRPETWGEPFKVEWVCWDRLPFTRTKHIRNPWNHDREVKVSRDGTEVEPTTGQLLLDEWEKYRQELQASSAGTSPSTSTQPWKGKKGGTRGESRGES